MNKLDHVIDSIKKYQKTLYSPGHYNGDTINPAFRTRPKSVGYLLCFYGGFSILFFSLQIFVNGSMNLFQGLFLAFSLIVIFYGIKIVRDNSRKK